MVDTQPRSQVVHIGFDFIIENRVLIMPQELYLTNHIIISVIQNQIVLVLLQIVILKNRLPTLSCGEMDFNKAAGPCPCLPPPWQLRR